jgi:hypothetical protein
MSVPLIGASDLPGTFTCKACGSSIKTKRDEDGIVRGLYHAIGGPPKTEGGAWTTPRVETVCLNCGDRVLLQTNCIDRVYVRKPQHARASPSDVASDPALVVLDDIECPSASCPTREPPPPGALAKPNRIALDQPDPVLLKPRYTCLHCKHQWMPA